ncbi:MAG TPA: DUF2341 domain-containing protein [Stenotrophomonas sp.]|nr:DUF2341 domain-containing protein [Stenotrophomonas sp.]
MQRILTTLLLLLGIAMSGVAGAQETSWWQAEWKYRKPITLDTTAAGLTTDAGRTPVLVRLHAGNFAFDGMAANGADLRFVSGDGRTVLNHQVEQFDAALGIAAIWVDVPALRTGAPQSIWMYYGNENAAAANTAQLVFDPDYVSVLHFADASGAPRDTTAYANHARNEVALADDGVVGRGARLSGEPLVIPAAASLQTAAGGAMTFSAWIQPTQAGANQALFSRRDGAGSLLAGLDAGVPFVEVNGVRAVGTAAVAEGQRSHVALVAGNGQVLMYVNGGEAVRLDAALPALGTDILIGGDAIVSSAGAEGTQPVAANGFVGGIDEVRLSKTARGAGLLQADVASQRADAKLLAFGEDEQTEGVSHFGFILKAMPFDAWVVVAILGLMMLMSWAIMIAKGRHFSRTSKANAVFTASFGKLAGAPLRTLGEMDRQGKAPTDMHDGSLWRIYQVAIDEMQQRHQRDGNSGYLSAATIAAIRASMDAVMVREQEGMAKRMNWLSTTIEGAPYVGLFGTVIGIMLVFVVAAMAGAVDINSVAPGMAAALLCTAAGLGVAIPALFGYNYLGARAEAIGADMAVFIDEFAARLAEEQDGRGPASVQG